MPTFKDAEFMTAAEKRKVLKAWTTFVRYGLQFKHFTKAIYSHLSLHCASTAHFDRGGFYGVYFRRPDSTLRFLDQFDPDGLGISVEYGTRHWLEDINYADINQAMREALRPFLPGLRAQLVADRLAIAEAALVEAQAYVTALRKG